MPEIVTTDALILNRRDWSESSRIVVMLTRAEGKLTAVARGARKLSSEIGPSLEPATESSVVLSISARSDMAHVRSAEVSEYFQSLKSSFIRMTLAAALCELVDRALMEAEPVPGVYDDVRDTLAGIDQSTDRLAVNWFWRGVLRIARELGYAMQFEACALCGSEEGPFPRFNVAAGGPVCSRCETGGFTRLSADAADALLWLDCARSEQIEDRRLSKPVNREIRDLVEEHFRYHLPNFHHLRSLDLLSPGSA